MSASATSSAATHSSVAAPVGGVPMPVSVPVPASDPGALTAADVSAADALIKKVNAAGVFQTQFAATPVRKAANYDWLKPFFDFLRKVGNFFSHLLEPIAPALPWLLYLGLFALVILILSPLVRALIVGKIERLFFRDRLKADAPWRPSAEAAAALIEEIDALAGQGAYDEAVHLLLKRSVADLNAYRPDLVRKHYSARDIGVHPLLPEDARPAFAEITGWTEKSFFAGIKVGREGFMACRQAYVDFVSNGPGPVSPKGNG